MQLPLTLGRYPVLGTLGRGGSGVVYRSEDPSTGRALALKTCTGMFRAERAALEREIAALGRLTQKQRPGVVQLLDAGVSDGKPWYAMPLISGQSLRAYGAELWGDESRPGSHRETHALTAMTMDAGVLAEPAPPSRAVPAATKPQREGRRAAAGKLQAVLELGLALAESLHWIHEDGVVHGDLTPGNVLRQADGRPVLVDFGTAFQLYEGELMREIAQDAGPRMGTPGYMAPEQIRGQGVDPRSDLYALGCILYELITGEAPFRAATAAELLRQHLSSTPRAPRELVSELAPELDALIVALLDKSPRRRPSRADDVLRCLAGLRGAPAPRASGANGPAALYRPQLVGRDAVLVELAQLLPQEPHAGGGCVCLRAPSGTGKTRLLNELRARATELGCDAIAISCSKADGGAREPAPSFVAFGAVLGQLAEGALACAPSDPALLEALAVLAPYAPGQLSGLGLPAQRNVSIAADVPRSLELVLRTYAQGGRLLLVLDDLQWADDLTLSFARERLAGLASAGVLVVASYRSDEIGERLAPLEAAARRLELPPLELPHVYAIVRDMLATESAPEGLPERLLSYSAGSPFLIAEYLRAAVARGLLAREPGGRWVLRGESGALESVPDSLQGLFLLRVSKLSDESRAVLELAAVLGRELDARELVSLRGGGEPIAALEELTREQILEYVGQGRYRFVNDKLREAQVMALAGERRSELHRLAATALDTGTEAPRPELAARLGVHWAGAGEAAKALAHLRAAADSAQSLHAHARATALYRLALTQCQLLRASDPDLVGVEGELQERLGDSLLAQAGYAEAREAYERALALAAGDNRLFRARNLRKIASSHWRVHAHAQAHENLQQAEATLGEPGPAEPPELHREYIEIQLGKFERLYFARDTSSAAQSLLKSLARPIASHAEPGQRVRYYLCAASDAMARSRYFSAEPALSFARQGTSVPAELLTRSEEALAQFIEGFALMLGDEAERREALEHFERAEHGAMRAGDRTLSSRVAMYQALTRLRLGDVEGTRAASQHALELAEVAKMGAYAAAAHACAAWALWRAPESDVALVRARAEEAQRLWRSNPANYPFRWCLNFVLLELALRQQDFVALRGAVEQLLDPMQQLFPPELEGELRRSAAALDEGLEADAARAVDAALRLAQRHGFC